MSNDTNKTTSNDETNTADTNTNTAETNQENKEPETTSNDETKNTDTNTKTKVTKKKQKIKWMGPYAIPAFRYTIIIVVAILILTVIVGGCILTITNSNRVNEAQAWIEEHQVHRP